jgi:hypothetical protein
MKWLIACAALLAACSNANVPPPPNAVQARYEPAAGAVRVLASAIRPMSDAALIAPDGRSYRSTGVVVVSGPHVLYNPPPSIGFGFGGFGFTDCCFGVGSGVGLSVPLGRPTPAEVSDQFLTSASIPAPADYAWNWTGYRVRVQLGDGAMLLPAPAPG